MGTLRRVIAVGRPFLADAGVDYLLLSVEVWTDGVVVLFGAEESETTVRLDAEYHEAMLAWTAAGRPKGEAPESSSVGLMRVPVSLADGCGTIFQPDSAGTANWRVEQRFRTGPAPHAQNLTLASSEDLVALEASPLTIDLSATAVASTPRA